MTRVLTPSLITVRRLSEADEAEARAALLYRLHEFAYATGAEPGDDVVRHFDCRLRVALEQQEIAARSGQRDGHAARP